MRKSPPSSHPVFQLPLPHSAEAKPLPSIQTSGRFLIPRAGDVSRQRFWEPNPRGHTPAIQRNRRLHSTGLTVLAAPTSHGWPSSLEQGAALCHPPARPPPALWQLDEPMPAFARRCEGLTLPCSLLQHKGMWELHSHGFHIFYLHHSGPCRLCKSQGSVDHIPNTTTNTSQLSICLVC